MLIYLVEDDNSIRELVAYTLHSAGFRAEGFEKPSAFWHACKTQLPDLVLLDLMLPEEDGISILRKLRNDPETKKMPIILLTAKSSEYDKVKGLDGGADDYVVKPFESYQPHLGKFEAVILGHAVGKVTCREIATQCRWQ